MSENQAGGLQPSRLPEGDSRRWLGTAAAAAGVHRRGATGGGRPSCPRSRPTAPSCVAWTWSPEPHDRGSLRVHVQEPAAAPGVGCAARPPGCRPWRSSPSARHTPTRSPVSDRPPRNNHNDALNENPNPHLTSGFTFVGQFVDHDITFDTTLLDQQQSDPYATTNFRTPRYDLDAIYGRGPSQDPQFYDPNDRDKFLIVERPYSQINGMVTTPTTSQDNVYDVSPTWSRTCPRDADGKAIIADPRNDQTLIILQLHVAMQMFHNKLVDTCARTGCRGRRCSSRLGGWPGGTTSGW